MALRKRMAGAAALGAAMLIGLALCAPPAQAAYTIAIAQVGSDVTATGAGSIDFTALAPFGDELDQSLIAASGGAIIIGPTTPTDDTYYIGVTGPAIAFGTGGEFFPNSGSGAIVGLGAQAEPPSTGIVAVPQGYVSGAPLGTSTATWTGMTLASLGLTPGTYTWSWGSGADADTFTIDIAAGSFRGPPPIPEPGTWAMMLLGFAGLALVQARRRIPASE
jgi:hypothetical protein